MYTFKLIAVCLGKTDSVLYELYFIPRFMDRNKRKQSEHDSLVYSPKITSFHFMSPKMRERKPHK